MIRALRRPVLIAATGPGRTALLVPAVQRAATAGDEEFTFTPGGIDGGGPTNVVAADPFHSGVVPAGQDTSGLRRSTDGTPGGWTDIADDTYRAMAQFPYGPRRGDGRIDLRRTGRQRDRRGPYRPPGRMNW